jgi:hypothetical protein
VTKKLKTSHHRPKVYKEDKTPEDDPKPDSYLQNANNPDIYISKRDSYYFNSVTNYQKAVIDGYRLLAYRKQSHPLKKLRFDREMCKALVRAYSLSCIDCELECEMHQLEASK